jgi:hypothetical protein
MRVAFRIVLIGGVSILLAGCALRGKQQTPKVVASSPPKPVSEPSLPPPPPPKLSVPQTNVELPPPQPVNLEALAAAQRTEEPPPAAPPTSKKSSRGSTSGATGRTETPPVTAPVGPVVEQTVPERAPVQEILPAADLKRLQDETANNRREAKLRLDKVTGRALTNAEKDRVALVASFLKESENFESRGEWRSAHEFAEKAFTVSKELTGGK